jgi:hypothetical protein
MARTSSSVRMAPSARTSRVSSPSLRRPAPSLRLLALERGLERGEGQAAGGQGRRIGHDLEAADFAAEAVHVGHAGHRAQRRTDRPVEQGALVFEGQIGPSMVNMNISPSGVVIGARPPRGAGRQVAHHAGEALAHLLAGPVDVGAVLEVEGDVGQRVLGRGTQDALVRNAEHLLFDRAR